MNVARNEMYRPQRVRLRVRTPDNITQYYYIIQNSTAITKQQGGSKVPRYAPPQTIAMPSEAMPNKRHGIKEQKCVKQMRPVGPASQTAYYSFPSTGYINGTEAEIPVVETSASCVSFLSCNSVLRPGTDTTVEDYVNHQSLRELFG